MQFESIIQPKIKIGQPNDRYEQEADRMADQVIQTPSPPAIQRKCDHCEEEQLQMKPLVETISPIIQKQSEEEIELQMKGFGSGQAVSESISSKLEQTRSSGNHLSKNTNESMSNAFGVDFSKVNIHTDANAVQMNRSLGARAFTNGNDIYFNQGEYNPESQSGKHLLAHELTHVVQQKESDTRIQRWATCDADQDCPERENGEISRARQASLQVSDLPAPYVGKLVSGFDIGSSSVESLDSADGWATFWGHMMNGPVNYEILGFSDCQGGGSPENLLLRWERAMAVNNILPSYARQKVNHFSAAPMTNCINSNSTEEGRSLNRSVAIRSVSTEYTFEDDNRTEAFSCPPRNGGGVSSISNYISLILCAEHATGYNNRQMLAMLRQLYYGKPWSATSTTNKWDNVIPCSPDLGNPRNILGENLFMALRNSAVVEGVDIGHVFTGLESMTCPSPNVSFYGGAGIVRMPNEEFSTWGGDLGAAVAAYVACPQLDEEDALAEDQCSRTSGRQSLSFYLREHAPMEDIQGDIDPFLMRAMQLGIPCTGSAGVSFNPTTSISDLFYQYYIDPPDGTTDVHENRYRCFLEAIGATLSGNRITNRSVLINAIAAKVYSFANAFYYGISGFTSPPDSGDHIRMRLATDRVVEAFISALESRL